MKFSKPVGATCDLRELEYVSALHQTGNTLRRDGSIKAEDVSKFLLSRYGVVVSSEEVAETISKGFGGGGICESDGDTLDLTEVMAMLLIPTLLKAEMSLHRDHIERELIKNIHQYALDDQEKSPQSLGADEWPDNPIPHKEDASDNEEEKKQRQSSIKRIKDIAFVFPFNNSSTSVGSNDTRRLFAQSYLDKRGERAENIVKDFDLHTMKAGTKDMWGGEALRGEPRWPDSDLIGFVLNMILKDVTGDDSPKPLTVELIKKIFIFYGEHNVAEDEGLLQEMISVAKKMRKTDEEDADILLDKFTFAHCLTDDVRKYNIQSENKLTTNYFDVFRTHHSTKESGDFFENTMRNVNNQFDMLASNIITNDSELEVEEEEEENTRPVEMRFTFPSIDYAVDTFRSKTYVILLWVTWVFFYAAFINGESKSKIGDFRCGVKPENIGFLCQIGEDVVKWIIVMAKLIIVGSAFIILSSIGHGINPTNPIFVVLSMGFICLFTIVPYFVEVKIIGDSDGGAVISSDENEGEYERFLFDAIISCGVMLLLLALQNLLDRLLPEKYLDNTSKKILSSGTVRMERNMKKAAAYKMNKMIRNARTVHQDAEHEHGSSDGKDSSYGRALLSYSKTSGITEESGGYLWVWNRLRNADLFEEDGIWLNNRVLQGNLGQLFLCVYLISLVGFVLESLNKLHKFLMDDPDIQVLMDEVDIQAPAKWRLMVPLVLAFLFSELNALALAAVYIPSSVRTILSYRYGTIPSLHCCDFLKLRRNTDEATFIFGSMFWGSLVSSVLVFFVTFFIFALVCFEPFFDTLLSLIATVIGIGITILVKSLFLMVARKFFLNGAFYRTNPAVANVVGVFLEAWNLGITILFVIKRFFTLVAAAFIFIGRIDIPFLAEGADEIGPVVLDKFPFIFRKDLLVHEAHRHPYLERLGKMYLLKLRYGESFGREAGTSWRLLFVFALMPWLRKYRIRSDENMDMTKFNFAEDGPVFQSFVKMRSVNPTVRRLETVEECDDNHVDRLQKLQGENEMLQHEVDRLMMMLNLCKKRKKKKKKEVEQLRSQISSLTMNSIT